MNRLYDTAMAPLEFFLLIDERRRLIPRAKGAVLELGAGTGINLRHYDWSRVEKLTLTDLAAGKRLKRRAARHRESGRITVQETDAGRLPFEENFFNTVVFTLLFCSLKEPAKALNEIKRVLKPDGRVVFMEHVLPGKYPWRGVFNFLTPFWKRLAGGCCLNRRTVQTFRENGFTLRDLRRFGLTFTGGMLEKRGERNDKE